ncbi:MAG: DNA repair protein RadC [Pseudomonadota bacterium]
MEIANMETDDKVSLPTPLPREKMRLLGAKSLSDAELLAILLRTGSKGLPVVKLAQQLIDTFGSLPQVLLAKEREICKVSGMGPVKFIQINAIQEMCRRYLSSEIRRSNFMNHSTQIKDYLLSEMRGFEEEAFGALFLDNQFGVIAFEILFKGTIDRTSVHPRTIAKRGLELNAAKIVLTHNHPSGDSSPSEADIEITQLIKQLMHDLDMEVIDHIIVGHQPTSMAELGYFY